MRDCRVIVEVTGPDERIEGFHLTTDRPIYAGPCRWTDESGTPVSYVAVTIVEGDIEEEEVVQRMSDWIESHRTALTQLNAKKTIEIQTAILPGEGSRALTLPLAVLDLLSKVECQLTHQYSRTLSSIELAARKQS